MSDDTQRPTRANFQWQLNWKILLFTAFFLPVTIKLALWQLDRAEEKEALIENYRLRGQAAPIMLAEARQLDDQVYVRVQVGGEYDNRSPLLLDNQVRHGRPGFEVVSPFKTETGQWLLVDRGWIPGSLDRSQIPDVPPVEGIVHLTGYLYHSPGKQLMIGDDPWPVEEGAKIIQNAAPEYVSEKLATTFYQYRLRLDQEEPGALETGWTVINLSPGKHIGYAVQWTALAVALVILSLFANSNLGAVITARRHMKRDVEGED
ncbi:MAG: SURF1 family protein [Porticoccaceae bacterium]